MRYVREELDKGSNVEGRKIDVARGRRNEGCLRGDFPLVRSVVTPSLSRLSPLTNTGKRVNHSRERKRKNKNILSLPPAITPYLTALALSFIKVAAVRNRRNRRVVSSVLLRSAVVLYVRQRSRCPRLSLRVPPGRRRPLCLSQVRGVHHSPPDQQDSTLLSPEEDPVLWECLRT